MLRRARLVIFVLIAAVAGAVAGRLAAEARRRREAGQDPLDLDVGSVRLRPQDLVPGIVAAVRVRDKPWSWLHIPSWLAAFAVNFGVAAVGGDLSRLRETAEHFAFGLAGMESTPADAHGEAMDEGDDGPPAPRWSDPPAEEPEQHPGFTAFGD